MSSASSPYLQWFSSRNEIGGVVCIATVWSILVATQNWLLSILLGLVLWFGSSMLVATLKEKIQNMSAHHATVRRAKRVVLAETQVRHMK